MTSQAGIERAEGLISALDALPRAGDDLVLLLRSYIQSDNLGDVCAAREAGHRLQAEVRRIATGLRELAEKATDERAERVDEPCEPAGTAR